MNEYRNIEVLKGYREVLEIYFKESFVKFLLEN